MIDPILYLPGSPVSLTILTLLSNYNFLLFSLSSLLNLKLIILSLLLNISNFGLYLFNVGVYDLIGGNLLDLSNDYDIALV